MALGTTLKRFIVGLFAAIAALLFARKKAAAPGGKQGEFKLAPVPDARASGPEDATPLTEDEQEMMAERAPDFKGFSAPPRSGVPIDKTSGAGGATSTGDAAFTAGATVTAGATATGSATPSKDDEQADSSQGMTMSESGETPPPISYKIAQQNADEAETVREAGDSDGADALEQRVYFTAPEASPGADPPPISDDLDQENADEADTLGEAGDAEAADARAQRSSFATSTDASDEVAPPISQKIAQENADAAESLRNAGNAEGADQLEQRVYFTTPEATASETPLPVSYTLADDGEAEYAEVPADTDHSVSSNQGGTSAGKRQDTSGDSTPESTSEAFDVVTDGADHMGQEAADREDPTEVGLDIDVDLDDEDSTTPELTSEAFDGGEQALGIAAGNQESAGDGFILVPDEQDWCPDEFPIKGNASSRIYHKPGESSYDATNPEICFASDEAAATKGFRPRKR